MADNQVIPSQPTPNQSINKMPPYVWIIIGILGLTIFFLIFCKSTDLSGNKSNLVQNEINDKIKILREDSVKKNRVTKFLETWENNLKLLETKLNQQNDSLIRNYKFPLTINDVNFTDDSVNSYSFFGQLNSATKNSLDPVLKINKDYGVFTVKKTGFSRSYDYDYTDNDFIEEDKISVNNLKAKISGKLLSAYNMAFSLSQSDDILNIEDDGYNLSRTDIERILNTDRRSIFQKGLDSWKVSVKSTLEEITDFKDALISEQKDTRGKIQGLLDETTEINSLSRDKVLLTKVLPVFTILILLLFAIPYIYRNVTVKDGTTESNVLIEIFSKGLLLKVFTVFLLTISIVLLAIGNKIQGETIGTLLGGISVYILQNSFGAGNGNNTPKPDAKPVEVPKPGA